MRYIVFFLFLLIPFSMANAQFSADGTSKGSQAAGLATLEIKNKAPGSAELVVSGIPERNDALYCFTGVGANWAGNTTGTRFDTKRMACATPKGGKAIVPVSVGNTRNIPLGLMPVSVKNDGALLSWEVPPQGTALHTFTSRSGRNEQITLLYVDSNGTIRPATKEEAKNFSD